MPSSDLLFYPEMASEIMKNTYENNFLIEGAVQNALEMSSELIICKWRLNWCLYSESELEHERELEKVYMKPPHACSFIRVCLFIRQFRVYDRTFNFQSSSPLSEQLYKSGRISPTLSTVNFQICLKINTTYPGEHSDTSSLELWPKRKQ